LPNLRLRVKLIPINGIQVAARETPMKSMTTTALLGALMLAVSWQVLPITAEAG
jgi:hypothetical protein